MSSSASSSASTEPSAASPCPARRRRGGAPSPVAHRGQEQLGRRQGLQQVMAGRRHEARPRGIRAFGMGQRVTQFQRAGVDPGLQRLVGRLSAAMARRSAVTSVKLITKPPSGIPSAKASSSVLAARRRLEPQRRARLPPRTQARSAVTDWPSVSAILGCSRASRSSKPARPQPAIGSASSSPPRVPAQQPRPGVEDADPLVDMVQRRPHQPGLVVQQLAALFAVRRG
jgi:hypothetical protein